MFLTYPGNKYNSNCFLYLYREYCPRFSHRFRKLGGVLDLGQYFPVQIEKQLLLCYHIILWTVKHQKSRRWGANVLLTKDSLLLTHYNLFFAYLYPSKTSENL